MNLGATLIGNRYRLYERLGAGGMGTVFRAEDRLTGSMLALKRVALPAHADVDATDQLRLALSREFRMLASLRHPNIISVMDYGFDAQRAPYFTMDWLRDATPITTAGANVSLDERVRLLAEMLRALAYLHRRGVIHRDLKPGNVLVESGGRVKVLDFGLALERRTDGTTDAEGGMTGTLAYLAPELLADAPPSVVSDLYSVGVMAYEIFAGRYPFSMKNAAQLISQIFSALPDLSALPPTLAPVLHRLLVKDPADRFPTADHVLAALSEVSGVALARESLEIRESYIRASTFVGREEELLLLDKALDAAFNGVGSAWLVGGESGVGKTRLLDEIRIAALVKGALVMRGTMSRSGAPYELWRDVMRRLVISTPLNDLEAGVLRAVVPDIDALLGRPIPDAPLLDGRASHQRLMETITDVLTRQTQPLVLLLEDLHWGEESVDVLSHIVEFAREHTWLIIGSYRDDEAPDLPEQFAHVRVIKLARLSDAELTRLSEAMLGEAGKQPYILDLLKRESEGNTFFITEVVRVLLEESGGMSEVGRVTLPTNIVAGGIQDVVRRRLGRVPEWAQPALRRAAVAGRAIDLKLLPAFGAPDVEAWLTAGINAAVIEVVDGAWSFAHDKLRDFIVKELAADEYAAVQRDVAEAIEQAYPNAPAYAERLADHWRLAGEPDKAFGYALMAGEYLIRLTAEYDRAERMLRLALNFGNDRERVLALLGEASLRRGMFDSATEYYQIALSEADPPLQIRIYNGLSEVARHLNAWDASTHYAELALELARARGDEPNIAVSLSNLGSVLFLKGDYAGAQAYYEQAVTIQKERADRAAVLGNLGIALYGLTRYRDAIKVQEEALALYQEVGSRRGIALTLNRLATVYWHLGEAARARGYYEESLATMRSIGDPMGVFDSLNNLGMISYGQAEYDKAYQRFDEALAVARRLGDGIRVARALNNAGATLKELGRYGEASQRVAEAISLNREHGDERELAYALNSYGDLLVAQGEHDQARDVYEESLALTVTLNDRQIRPINLAALALIYARAGELPAARRALADGLEIALETHAKPRMAGLLLNAALVLSQQAEPERAALLGGVIDSLNALEGEHLPAFMQLRHDLRSFAAAWERGRERDPETEIATLIQALRA